MIPMSDYVAIFKEHGRTEAIVYNSKTGKRFSKINVPKNNKLVALQGQVYAIGCSENDLSAKVLEDGD